MRVEMTGYVSGTRDGKQWPAPGEVVDLPDIEAQALVSAGMAKPAQVDAQVEAAVPDSSNEETAIAPTKPVRKAPGKPRKP